MRWPARLALLVVMTVALPSCGTDRSPAEHRPTTAPAAVDEAVAGWLGHLAGHDDAAAFADLAPGSQAAVGDIDNYRRGSGRFAGTYIRFSTAAARTPLRLSGDLWVVTLSLAGDPPASAGVPVRRTGATWRVDPLRDVGSYSFRPDDGATVGPRPVVTVQLDDPGTRATVWFDVAEAQEQSPTSFRPRQPLSKGRHVVTIALQRGSDVVARTRDIEVE